MSSAVHLLRRGACSNWLTHGVCGCDRDDLYGGGWVLGGLSGSPGAACHLGGPWLSPISRWLPSRPAAALRAIYRVGGGCPAVGSYGATPDLGKRIETETETGRKVGWLVGWVHWLVGRLVEWLMG